MRFWKIVNKIPQKLAQPPENLENFNPAEQNEYKNEYKQQPPPENPPQNEENLKENSQNFDSHPKNESKNDFDEKSENFPQQGQNIDSQTQSREESSTTSQNEESGQEEEQNSSKEELNQNEDSSQEESSFDEEPQQAGQNSNGQQGDTSENPFDNKNSENSERGDATEDSTESLNDSSNEEAQQELTEENQNGTSEDKSGSLTNEDNPQNGNDQQQEEAESPSESGNQEETSQQIDSTPTQSKESNPTQQNTQPIPTQDVPPQKQDNQTPMQGNQSSQIQDAPTRENSQSTTQDVPQAQTKDDQSGGAPENTPEKLIDGEIARQLAEKLGELSSPMVEELPEDTMFDSQGLNENEDSTTQNSEIPPIESTDDKQDNPTNQETDNQEPPPAQKQDLTSESGDSKEKSLSPQRETAPAPPETDDSKKDKDTETDTSTQQSSQEETVQPHENGEIFENPSEPNSDKGNGETSENNEEGQAEQSQSQTTIPPEGDNSQESDSSQEESQEEGANENEIGDLSNNPTLSKTALKNLPHFTERQHGDGFDIVEDDVSIPTKIIQMLISKFLDQRFKRKESDLNERSYSFERKEGLHKWDIPAIAVHAKTKQLTKVLQDRYGYEYEKGKNEQVPLSFYFDLSGSMSAYSSELATIVIELSKRDVKTLVGFNERVIWQIDKVSKQVDIETLSSLLTNSIDNVLDIRKNKFIQAKLVNNYLDTYLKDAKAEKCVVFSDFDPLQNVISLSKFCKTYWFCFENNFTKQDIRQFKGFIWKTQDMNDLRKGLVKVNKSRFEALCHIDKGGSGK